MISTAAIVQAVARAPWWVDALVAFAIVAGSAWIAFRQDRKDG